MSNNKILHTGQFTVRTASTFFWSTRILKLPCEIFRTFSDRFLSMRALEWKPTIQAHAGQEAECNLIRALCLVMCCAVISLRQANNCSISLQHIFASKRSLYHGRKFVTGSGRGGEQVKFLLKLPLAEWGVNEKLWGDVSVSRNI